MNVRTAQFKPASEVGDKKSDATEKQHNKLSPNIATLFLWSVSVREGGPVNHATRVIMACTQPASLKTPTYLLGQTMLSQTTLCLWSILARGKSKPGVFWTHVLPSFCFPSERYIYHRVPRPAPFPRPTQSFSSRISLNPDGLGQRTQKWNSRILWIWSHISFKSGVGQTVDLDIYYI